MNERFKVALKRLTFVKHKNGYDPHEILLKVNELVEQWNTLVDFIDQWDFHAHRRQEG